MSKKRVSSDVFEDTRNTRSRPNKEIDQTDNPFELDHEPIEIDEKSNLQHLLGYLVSYSDDSDDEFVEKNDNKLLARECKLPQRLKWMKLPDELLKDDAYQASQKCPLCDDWFLADDECIVHPGSEFDDAYKKWTVHQSCTVD